MKYPFSQSEKLIVSRFAAGNVSYIAFIEIDSKLLSSIDFSAHVLNINISVSMKDITPAVQAE